MLASRLRVVSFPFPFYNKQAFIEIQYDIEGFQWSPESNSRLLWFCFATLCDLLQELSPLSQPIRTKPIVTSWLYVFASSTDWYIAVNVLMTLDGFDFTLSIEAAL